MSADIEKALSVIIAARVREIDSNRIPDEGRYFLAVATIGIPSRTVVDAPLEYVFRHRRLAYAMAAL